MILEYQGIIYNAGTLKSWKFAYSFQRKQKTVNFIQENVGNENSQENDTKNS